MGSLALKHEHVPELHFSTSFLEHQRATAAHYRREHDGMLPDTPFWWYLEELQAEHPERWDHYHPLIAHWIAEVPVVSPPGGGMTTPPSQDGNGVPEPTSWILLIISIAIVGIFRGRR
jgi:PEP-CTERM motif-containing protein